MQVARYPNEIYPYLVSYRSIRVAMFSSKRIDGVRIRFFFYQQFMPPWKTGTYCSSIGHQLLIYLLEKLYCACAVKFLLLGVRPLVNGREAAIEDRNFRSRLYMNYELYGTTLSGIHSIHLTGYGGQRQETIWRFVYLHLQLVQKKSILRVPKSVKPSKEEVS